MFLGRITARAQALCAVPEYDELPVRHNEDKLNGHMARSGGCVRVPVDTRALDDPHVKASLLLQVRACKRAGKRACVCMRVHVRHNAAL